ncbi:hypothetical protein SeMB42_g07039 [Synchytrium endobioticum]|uniref:DUF2470 domain-containing protein n=1 Tax=Synchytrium endobioticum TaxID=286115 RepID=A0A507C6Z2_9FUNG|nr:hypothetical protein SeMB42_g07039 [Synchytrium endobioticum]
MASLRKRAGKDPISAFSAEICAHMNTSHADSVEAYARHFAAASAVYGARMAGIDADGFTVEYRETRDGPARDVRIQFDTPLASHEHARAVLVRMADEAVKAVGMALALSALHALEAVVCIVIGMWSRVHPVVIVWYALSTLVFGVSALKMMTKASITEAGRHNETGLGGLTVFDWLGINTDMVPDSFVNFEEDDEQPQIAEVVDDEDEDEVIVRK